MPPPGRELKYNLAWIEGTFKSRPNTELLLAPEREEGNLTTNDYELATRFLPGPHRYYPRGYGAIATGATFLYARSRRWSTPRLVFVGAAAYTLGFSIGQAARLRLHLRFLSRLENFDGFSAAIDNINVKTGGIMPRGPTLVVSRKNGGLGVRPDITGGEAMQADTSSVPSKPTKTRWDEIRIANAQSASQSSWELIRQKNGRASMQNNKAAGSRKQPEESLENADAERKAEQAGFDAMLEAERKAGQNV
ncbi:hypothetical protein PLEOSDRAFT_1096030 [Pleurotus ostreatus PC15]|uniref:Uncharacterized protein n=1 Tax=Pleurotus ostreatus (strain PC15) TaxID=1137138 RepID=A0A067P4A3_PLEO1|nr:hypothetical protein PLEOSDRAFT_1096030 [Pleurotus ostreatus PC15]